LYLDEHSKERESLFQSPKSQNSAASPVVRGRTQAPISPMPIIFDEKRGNAALLIKDDGFYFVRDPKQLRDCSGAKPPNNPSTA